MFVCSVVSDSATPCTVAQQAPLSIGFPRQEYWSGLPFPTPRDLPDPAIYPESLVSPAFVSGFFTTSAPGKPDTSRMSYNLIQFWHCLPGESFGSHRLRALSHRTPPFNSHFQTQVEVVPCASDSLALDRVFPRLPPHSGSIHLLEQLTELREPLHLLGHQFVIKGSKSGTARWRRCPGQGVGKGRGLPQHVWA